MTFAQQPGTAISPSLSIDFGTGIDMVPPGDLSGEMTFQIRRQAFVAEEVEVCFDVIPQNPQGGDCCKDDFCITLPVCCEPEETTSIDFAMNTESEDCCYDLEVSNLCAENYFTGLLGNVVGDGITITAQGQNGWTAETVPFFGTDLIAFYFGEEDDQNFVPIIEEPSLIATVCLDGVTSENVDDQQFNITWANIGEDGENGEFAFGEEFITECEAAPCNLIFNPTITCDDENNYQLTFLLQMSEDETRVAQQLVINPLGNTQVSQYSPQTFDDVMLSPGEMRSFTIDLHEVDQGETFEFQVTMHNFNEPLEDGTYWCCYNGQEVSMTIPPCIQGIEDPNDQNLPPVSYTVYPNPIKDKVTLAFETETEESYQLEIIDIQGSKTNVAPIPIGVQSHTLDFSDKLRSIYFIRIKSESGKTLGYRKIMKL